MDMGGSINMRNLRLKLWCLRLVAVAVVVGAFLAALPTSPSGENGLLTLSSARGESAAHSACEEPGAIEASELPQSIPPADCDLRGRTIVDNGIGVVVPGPGFGAEVYVDGEESGDWFAVSTEPDGTVELHGRGGEETLGDAAAQESGSGEVVAAEDLWDLQESNGATVMAVGPGGSGDECLDNANTTYGFRESDVHKWYLNRNSIPLYLNEDRATARIREGGAHITNETTNCNYYRPDFPTGISYQGSTSRTSDMGWEDGRFVCWPAANPRDGVNVVDFGNMPSTYRAGTCNYRHWYSRGELTESDVRFNSSRSEVEFYDTNWKPASCDGRTDLEGLATHERGHTFGLAHVSAKYHPTQTMRSPGPRGCTLMSRTLGLGDLYGLTEIYR